MSEQMSGCCDEIQSYRVGTVKVTDVEEKLEDEHVGMSVGGERRGGAGNSCEEEWEVGVGFGNDCGANGFVEEGWIYGHSEDGLTL